MNAIPVQAIDKISLYWNIYLLLLNKKNTILDTNLYYISIYVTTAILQVEFVNVNVTITWIQ